MKAIIRTKAGKEFSTMKVQEISGSIPQSGELKVKMISSRVNPVDMDLMKGFPTLKYKKPQIGGIDGAGIITEVGAHVNGFSVGDKVIFYRLFSDIGTWAEEITISATDCALLPESADITTTGAIALPILTAYDSLQQFHAKKEEKILIHGVGGGVGFQALQIAKKMGLYVIGTGSAGDKADLEKAGLNQFIDYKTQDFAMVLKAKETDYIFDTLGDEVLKKSIALQPKKIVSLKYADPQQMHKAGVHLPGIMKWIISLTMNKFTKLAKKNKVEIIGQVTGANGKMMQKAIDLLQPNLTSRNFKTLNLEEISRKGLSKTDIGKVIIF